jgi:hypothetical protein
MPRQVKLAPTARRRGAMEAGTGVAIRPTSIIISESR